MNKEITITIPAFMLRYTVSALDELAIRQKMEAEKPGVDAQEAETLRKQAEAASEAAELYHRLYNRALFPEVYGEVQT